MLTREAFAALGLQGLSEIEAAKEKWHYTIRGTSGTTGSTPILVARHVPKDPRLFVQTHRTLTAGGTLGHRGTLIAMFFFGHHGNVAEASIASVGGEPTPTLRHAIEEFDPDSLFAVVSYTLSLFSRLKPKLRNLRKVTWGGEHVSDASVEAAHTLFPEARIESWYGCAELGNLVLPQCPYRSRFEFHPLQGVEVSLDSPDEEGNGRLLFSTALTESVQVKEYAPGEIGSISRDPCPCGERVTFTVRGRADFDIVRVAGAILHVEECERVMRELTPLVLDYQVIASEVFAQNVPHGHVKLHIVPTRRLSAMSDPKSTIRAEFERRLFVTPKRTLGKLIEEGRFTRTNVVFVDHIQHGPKRIRLKRDS